jgi:hypothetical protein
MDSLGPGLTFMPLRRFCRCSWPAAVLLRNEGSLRSCESPLQKKAKVSSIPGSAEKCLAPTRNPHSVNPSAEPAVTKRPGRGSVLYTSDL